MPPIRSGSTCRSACTLRPDGCSIWPRMRPNSVVGQLVRGRDLDVEDALLRRDERVELVGELAELARASLLGEQAHEVDDELVRALRRSARARRSFTRESTSGFSSSACRSSASRRRRRASSRELAVHGVERAPLLRGLEEGARVDAVRDGYDRLPSSWVKSISASASSISRCWSASVSDLRVIFSAARSAELADLVADLRRAPAAVACSIWRRVSSRRRWRSSSVSTRTRSRCASAMRRASARISSASRLRLRRSACGAPRAASAPRRARGRPRRSPAGCARAACRSSAGSARTRSASARTGR